MIQPSPFDSDVLGRRVGTVALDGLDRERLEELRAAMPPAGVDLLFIKDRRFAFDRVHELSWHGLELADVKVILSRSVHGAAAAAPGAFEVEEAAGADAAGELRPLARAIARQSRFVRCFGEEAAFRLYDRWLENSLARRAADWCLVARERRSGEAAGLVTVKRDGASADLALVATAERYRGQGVLRLLAAAALTRLGQEGIAACTVGTQLSNRTAIRAYEALGFQFESTVVDLHLSRT